MEWWTLKTEPVRGAVAISATLAVGRPYVLRLKRRPFMDFTLAWSGTDSWDWLRGLPPDEELGGGAILVWKDVSITREAAGQ